MPKPYYIFSNGTIQRKDNTIYIENEANEKRAIPIEDVESLHLFGEINLNSKFLNFISQQNKPLHIYNYYGFYSGSFIPRNRNVSGELLVRQVQFYLDKENRLYLAQCFVDGALFHILRNLREYKETEIFQEKIKEEQENAKKSATINELMGAEGRARDTYYQAFNTILKGKFEFEKREKHPPSNPINAMISFANSLVYTTVISQIYITQLNPTISYLHEPSDKRFSLSLDIAEIFKPLIGDPIIFKMVNNNMIKEDDFDKDLNYCYLKEQGRKKFLREFDQKLQTTIKHRKLKRNVSYKTIIRYECYKLIKHLVSDEIYMPFKAWW